MGFTCHWLRLRLRLRVRRVRRVMVESVTSGQIEAGNSSLGVGMWEQEQLGASRRIFVCKATAAGLPVMTR